jgi:hypothetical protein
MTNQSLYDKIEQNYSTHRRADLRLTEAILTLLALPACMSGFAIAEQSLVERGVANLQRDLQTGKWDEKYGLLREKKCTDVGYRFVLSRSVG